MALCSGIKADGGRCRAQAMRNSQWCIGHDPDQAEGRRSRASKGGKRGGRGRANRELSAVKSRLTTLAEGVIRGDVIRGDAAVAGQLYNVVLRAIATEIKVREVEELEARLTALEELEEQSKGRYGRA